jgi:hypothetical protein
MLAGLPRGAVQPPQADGGQLSGEVFEQPGGTILCIGTIVLGLSHQFEPTRSPTCDVHVHTQRAWPLLVATRLFRAPIDIYYPQRSMHVSVTRRVAAHVRAQQGAGGGGQGKGVCGRCSARYVHHSK